MKPSVSVVIPFYNRVDWLAEAVKSVLFQTYQADEIIVVNDGSKENMTDFLELFSNSITYIFKENGGPGTARNVGIECSKGDYIAFLDSDDLWLPNKLERQIQLMFDKGYIWSHTSYSNFGDCDPKIISIKGFNGDIYPDMLPSCPLATPCVVVKGDVLRNNPELRFSNHMRYGEDTHLWLSLGVRYKILAIDEVLTMVRIRGDNAGLRARVQLRVRGVIWRYMKQNEEIFFKKKIPTSVSFAFRISVFGTAILEKAETIIHNERYLECISRGLYAIPWLIFKASAKR